MLTRLRDFEGWAVDARDGHVGSVSDSYFDDQRWAVRYLVTGTGGWLTGRSVLVSPMSIGGVEWDHHRIGVDLTREDVERSPSADVTKPVSRQYEADYLSYLGYPYYWTGTELWGVAPRPIGVRNPALQRERETNDQSSHLRSAREVSGYHINALDGEIGHVEDFLIDGQSWAIRYLLVDTSNWIGGRTILVSPTWVRRVDWPGRLVHVDVSRKSIAESPQFDIRTGVDRAYEEKLHGHYGKPLYWR